MSLFLTSGYLMGECEICEGPITSNKFDSDDCRHDETDEYFIEMTCVANSRHKFRFRIFPDVGAELVDSTVERDE